MTNYPGWPVHGEDEIAAVARVLRAGKGNYWFGDEGRAFEREFAAYCGARHAVAVANGTLALELALRALGIGPGDEVVVTPRSFVASASCVVQVGATPMFADVDPESQGLTVETIRAVLSPRTRAIIPVHLGGWPCDMPAIMNLARSRGLKVIEDCAQAHGATVDGQRVGSFGDCAAFSFCQDKIMSTGGEGGMLLVSDDEVFERARSYKDHGKDVAILESLAPGPSYRWIHDSIGTNWRLTEMQSAIGRIQLRRLDGWIAHRQRHAMHYAERLRGHAALRVPLPTDGRLHAWYKFYAFVNPDCLRAGWDRNRIVATAQKHGVPCFTGSCGELYRERAFANLSLPSPQPLKEAPRLHATSLMLPVHPTLAEKHVDEIANRLIEVVADAAK